MTDLRRVPGSLASASRMPCYSCSVLQRFHGLQSSSLDKTMQSGGDSRACYVNADGTLVEALCRTCGLRRTQAPGPQEGPIVNGVAFKYTDAMLSSGNLPGVVYTFAHREVPGMDELQERVDYGSVALKRGLHYGGPRPSSGTVPAARDWHPLP